jgi:ABC-2 type transport system permease protein
MTAATATTGRTAGVVLPDRPPRIATRLAVRQIRRGALIVIGLTAGMSALVAATYAGVMADPAAAGSLQALAGNPAIRTLFGEPVALDNAGGFTVWRVGTFVAVLLGVWAILATTRITRGEEDAGRWDVLLAGRLTVRTAVARHVTVVMAVAFAAGSGVSAVLLIAGTPSAGALIHGVGTGVLGMYFAAVAGLAAQVFPARTPATGTAVAVLGVGLLTRMVGDGIADLSWLRWLSPFGLLALAGPYHQDRILPLLVLLAATLLVAATMLLAAGWRDVRGGLVAASPGRPPRLRLLGSVEAFAVRRLLRPLTGWALGIGAYYLLIGMTAVSVTEFLADNPALAHEAAEAGFADIGAVEGFTATLFAILALPVGGFTAVRMAAFVAAETDRRLTMLAAQPVSRLRPLGAELLVTAAGAVVLVSVAGLITWCGVVAVGGELSLLATVQGAWNPLPIVLLSLAAAALAVGWAPRAVAVVGALPATGGFLLLVIAESIGAPDRVRDLSPFAHLAPVPVQNADWPATAAMTGLAVILTAVAAAGYRRRDLRL